MTFTQPPHDFRDLFIGLDVEVPLLNGQKRPYINLDNASSTPSFLSTHETVNNFLQYYSSVHRGTGFKSQLSTHVYEQARQVVLGFVGADPSVHVCIFVKNTTEAINKLARRFPFEPDRNVVLVSGMEHHSNDLPWRSMAETVHIALDSSGGLDERDFDEKLSLYGRRVALVSITGASNVTGIITPIHRLAEKAHRVGAKIAVDSAQLAPHRKIQMLPVEDPRHLDYVAISAHKMYAPFGSGALVGLKETFEKGEPDMQGGGTVEIVTLDDVVWAGSPDRDEAGSPNLVGAVALAAAADQLETLGMDIVAGHEASLTEYALRRLKEIPGLRIYGDQNPSRAPERLGVIPFMLENVPQFLVAAVLGHEFGIGVRSGCFCAHPYVIHLLDLSPSESEKVRNNMLAGDKSKMPGLIRASFGLYNTTGDVDTLVDALACITREEYAGKYVQDRASGQYNPDGWEPDFEKYFTLAVRGR
jgi:cysteine desulfurase / selenocysteine lyase